MVFEDEDDGAGIKRKRIYARDFLSLIISSEAGKKNYFDRLDIRGSLATEPKSYRQAQLRVRENIPESTLPDLIARKALPNYRIIIQQSIFKDMKAEEWYMPFLDGYGAIIVNSDLSKAELSGSDFRFGRFNGTKFEKARLVRTYFSNAVLKAADFNDADLTEARFLDADLSGSRLEKAILVKVRFDNANLSKANFRGANLSGADFPHATLVQTDFQNADLSGAVFTSATIREARFQGANLKGARFIRADLTGAYFDEANMEGVEITKCIGYDGPAILSPVVEETPKNRPAETAAKKTETPDHPSHRKTLFKMGERLWSPPKVETIKKRLLEISSSREGHSPTSTAHSPIKVSADAPTEPQSRLQEFKTNVPLDFDENPAPPTPAPAEPALVAGEPESNSAQPPHTQE